MRACKWHVGAHHHNRLNAVSRFGSQGISACFLFPVGFAGSLGFCSTQRASAGRRRNRWCSYCWRTAGSREPSCPYARVNL